MLLWVCPHYTDMNRYLAYIFFITFIFSCGKQEVDDLSVTDIDTSQYGFSIIESSIAGDDVWINITGDVSKSNDFYFLIFHPLGRHIMDVNENFMQIPKSWTKRSGEYDVEFYHFNQLIEKKKFQVMPREAIGDLNSYIGPKSIITTINEPCMIIGIPTDTFNNPMMDGTQVAYNLQRPGLDIQNRSISIQKLTSNYVFNAQTLNGKTLVGINCNASYSMEKYVDEEPGWPKQIRISPIPKTLKADGKQFVTISTEQIRDALNNIVMDGTQVTFFLLGDDGSTNQFTSLTVDGKSKIFFQHPRKTMTFQVYAVSGNIKSNTIPLAFETNAKEVPMLLLEEDNLIRIGPITSHLQQFIPDGSKIRYAFYQDGQIMREGTVATQKGMTLIRLEDLVLDPGEYIVECEYEGNTSVMTLNIGN